MIIRVALYFNRNDRIVSKSKDRILYQIVISFNRLHKLRAMIVFFQL